LRERPGDVKVLVEHLLTRIPASPETVAELTAPDFLEALASGPDQVYRAYTSADLPTIFQKVAQDIKLRLVL